jgi:hypothetical protein
VLLAFSKYARHGEAPDKALQDAIQTLCSPVVARILNSHAQKFTEGGLDSLSQDEAQKLRQQLTGVSCPFAKELVQWLDGTYIFGLEGMLDQSCFDSI